MSTSDADRLRAVEWTTDGRYIIVAPRRGGKTHRPVVWVTIDGMSTGRVPWPAEDVEAVSS